MKGQMVLSGVGGQGVLFATKILSSYARTTGSNVIGSETHGMAQRGGSVTSHLKIGDYKSPLVRSCSADWLFSFEPSETYRSIHFVKDGGTVFVNAPSDDFLDKDVASELEKHDISVHAIDANRISAELGAPLSANLVLLGFAAGAESTGIDADKMRETVSENTPERFREKNIEAFNAGLRIKD